MHSAPLATRYVAWLTRRWLMVLLTAGVMLSTSIHLVATRLPLRADVAHLLPASAPSVRDLHTIEARVPLYDTVAVLIEAEDPAVRTAAAAAMATGMRAIDKALVADVQTDDAEARAFVETNLYHYVPLPQLEQGRDALRALRAEVVARANPLLVDFDDDDDEPGTEPGGRDAHLADLRQRWRDLRERLARSGYVGGDVQRVMLRIAFDRTQTRKAATLVGQLEQLRRVVVAAHPGARIGVAGGVAVSVAEHDALVDGMVISALGTALLVGLVLIGFLRSRRLVAMVGLTLAVSTTIAFGFAAILVGQLNAATAFLGAIIAGNGVNYGVLLVARYQEARATETPAPALAVAIAGTLRPTLVASLAAAVAYGSLATTSFRGFADFALIGGIGMVVCWIGAFVLLPALIVRFGATARLAPASSVVGVMLARVFGFRRPGVVLAIAAALGLASTAIVVRYVAADPLEYDLRELRADGARASEGRRWLALSDRAFGPGLTNQVILAVDDPGQVPGVVAALRQLERDVAEPARLIGETRSMLDVVPADQPARRVVLGELRALIDDPVLAQLDHAALAELRALRPPDVIEELHADALPAALIGPLRERDGAIGRLIAVRPGPGYDEWDGRVAMRFAATIRGVHREVDGPIAIVGSAVIFADLIEVIRRDGPRVTLVAMGGLIVLVLLIVGRDRRAVAVLIATALGTVAMVAVCALLGLRVNFLDFVALPITLGLGVDYAINLAHRQHVEGDDPLRPLRTSGAAVLVCSLTTVIGYGSLLVSENVAIRDFGLAALIGEVTCLLSACVVVPAIFTLRRRPAAASDASR